MKVFPTDIRNEDKELVKIEFHDEDGDFVVEALWDESDAHTEENEAAFRKWAFHMMRRRDYQVEIDKKSTLYVVDSKGLS